MPAEQANVSPTLLKREESEKNDEISKDKNLASSLDRNAQLE